VFISATKNLAKKKTRCCRLVTQISDRTGKRLTREAWETRLLCSFCALALIGTGSVLLGVIVTSFFNLRVARITKESEERKHHKEIVVKAAIENWKQINEVLFKSGQQRFTVRALDPFLVHMSALADIIFDPTTNADNLKERLSKVDKLLEIANQSTHDLGS
jgi:hypothetical protein